MNISASIFKQCVQQLNQCVCAHAYNVMTGKGPLVGKGSVSVIHYLPQVDTGSNFFSYDHPNLINAFFGLVLRRGSGLGVVFV